jgi:hypothetical protein
MTYDPRPEIGTPLDSAIAEMVEIAKQHPDQLRMVTSVKGALEVIRDRFSTGADARDTCSRLFNLYFHYQDQAQDAPPMPHILRVVGDDLGITLGLDGDEVFDLYEQSLDLHS